MPTQNRLEINRSRISRYPRTWINAKTGARKTVENSDMDYLERVKQYVNLKEITNREDLNIRLVKEGLLGTHRQYKQLNILAKEIGLSIRGTPKELNGHTEQTFYKDKTSRVIYRDKKTGKFIIKPKRRKKNEQ